MFIFWFLITIAGIPQFRTEIYHVMVSELDYINKLFIFSIFQESYLFIKIITNK